MKILNSGVRFAVKNRSTRRFLYMYLKDLGYVDSSFKITETRRLRGSMRTLYKSIKMN